MKNLFCKALYFTVLIFVLIACNKQEHADHELDLLVEHALDVAKAQSLEMANVLADRPGEFPTSINNDGILTTSSQEWWCSGFFPGVLWYLYENFQDSLILEYAKDYTSRINPDEWNSFDHDIGFMVFCSYGNGYRLTGADQYKEVIHKSAIKLASRLNPKVDVILSWNRASWNEQWQYPVIIDNMMNLELLTWAGKTFNDSSLINVAAAHANTTIKNHFRDDYSTYHVVSYDTTTGMPELKHTSQGYSHESAWARGQSWGLYGYTMMYRETQNPEYLHQALHIADFLINHPNMPEDKIPYWDYDAPGIPNALRDASAGAIMASALLELSTLTENESSELYWNTALTQLKTLCSEEYLAEEGTNGNFIIKHCVGHMPNKSEVDVPLSYADYYFIEALTRYKNIVNK